MQQARQYLQSTQCVGLTGASDGCVKEELRRLQACGSPGVLLLSRSPDPLLAAMGCDARGCGATRVVSLSGPPTAGALAGEATAVIAVGPRGQVTLRGADVTLQNIKSGLTTVTESTAADQVTST